MRHVSRLFILGGLLFLLSACSYIASLFPDKQKQYRYHSEIPPLEIPPDLSSSTIEGATVSAEPGTVPTQGELAGASGAASAKEPPEPEEPDPKSTLAQNLSDIPLIEVEAPFEEAWRSVGRALGRAKIEVTGEDQPKGVFDVYFNGTGERSPEDVGLFSGMLGGGDATASSFHVHVEQKKGSGATQVFVTDGRDKPQTSGLGLELLKSIHGQFQKSGNAQSAESSAPEKNSETTEPDEPAKPAE